ncbi:MAG: DUF2244 domain-containing protein [Gammaproteobacteria bacterium]
MSATSTISNSPNGHVWVISPHRTLSWPQAVRVLCVISLLPLGSGALFLCLGAPLVLPFAGLELALLWAAFYCVAYTGGQREVVRIDDSTVTVEKGRSDPSEIHHFDRAWVRVDLRRNPNPWYPVGLWLSSHGREVAVGEFLTDAERFALARSLINAIQKSR